MSLSVCFVVVGVQTQWYEWMDECDLSQVEFVVLTVPKSHRYFDRHDGKAPIQNIVPAVRRSGTWHSHPVSLSPPLTLLNSYTHSLGRYGCIGKPLAMQVLRLMLARILLDFDMQFAPGFVPGRFLSSVRNIHTTLFKYPLLVELRDRGSPDS